MNVLLGNNARLSSLWKWLAEKLRSGEPEASGHIHRFREADARSAHQRIFLFRPFDVKRRFKQRHPVVPMRDAQCLRDAPRSRAQQLCWFEAASLTHCIKTRQRFDRANQHSRAVTFFAANEVEAPVDSV